MYSKSTSNKGSFVKATSNNTNKMGTKSTPNIKNNSFNLGAQVAQQTQASSLEKR